MAYFRVQLMRSAIGLPKRSSGVLAALGLRKRMSVVYHPVSQSVAGQIMKVKELVEVKEVEHALTKAEEKALRTPPSGFKIEKRAGNRVA